MTQWRYFQFTAASGKTTQIFRWPSNGKGLAEQRLAEVEVYVPGDGQWIGSQREKLLKQAFTGWFDETTDEISETAALDLISRLH